MSAPKKEKKKKGKKDAEAPEEKPEGSEASSDSEGGEGAAGEEEGGKKKLSGKTLVLFVALPVLVLIIGGVAAAFFLGVFGGKKEPTAEEAAKAAEAAAVHTVFFDMPEILVNLSGGDDKTDHFLKLSLSLELPNAEATKGVEEAMPRVIDSAQVFLRELRLDDLEGSAGMLRLREELLRRVNVSVAPVKVHDVLFKEIIIQ